MHAIFNAASRLTRDVSTVLPEIEIPLNISKAEMEIQEEDANEGELTE